MSFSKLATFVAVAAMAVPALAHIEMVDPVPLRSPKNPNQGAGVDYTYTDPLKPDGSNYPCKGYAGDGGPAVATLNAGSSYKVQLAGSAVHGGGSCQFALSYDGGNTWGAIHSIIGNCPTENAAYDVPIPAGLPSATGALFAWTWFNHIGNREMYMNCAVVDVMGASGSIELPRMFEANHFGGECKTPEGKDVDFNAPVLDNCPADKLITPDKKVTLGSGAPAAPPTTPSTTAAPPATTDADPCPPEDDPTTPVPPPTTSGTTPPPATGGANAWDAAKVYVSGDAACYSGTSYTAKWWTQGETPGAGDVWAAGGAC